jgi:DNA-binding transcriptional ArsR family regulator
MPSRIKFVKYRLILARLVISLTRTASTEYVGTERVGSQADDVLLLAAVFIGQAEGKPMTAHKLSDFIGMPRPTVVRKLRELQTAGLVELDSESAAKLIVAKLNSPALIQATYDMSQAVHKAAAELSKLDREAIANKLRPT